MWWQNLGRRFAHSVRNTVKSVDSRKTFLLDRYAHLLRTNPVLLITHQNHMNKVDSRNLRSAIAQAGGQLTVIRAGVFRAALRTYKEKDPASKEAYNKTKDVVDPVSELIMGPTAVIAFPEQNMHRVKEVVEILRKSNDKLLLLGARIDGTVLDVAGIAKVQELGTIDDVRAQLLGVLSTVGGAELARVLEASGSNLLRTFEGRKKALEDQ
ncbi:hypothetical protein CANCADRAFT_23315 [Tortispora caseinolytica NRRL Y-17796]|uniref:Ribosomal protein L10 n=1 Tax=Tortispora caseinolytica NRRL Y-17796 TaxID=767744 RepID=A0A1E4TM19_9ASCO|nr:hypothetical protein CANCADRAFT_23315 [Tortispora caseinolytica NRRL Y-17796]